MIDSWSHQVRSYLFLPDRKFVKDLRSGIVRQDAEAVLDGDIDCFLAPEIRFAAQHREDMRDPVQRRAWSNLVSE